MYQIRLMAGALRTYLAKNQTNRTPSLPFFFGFTLFFGKGLFDIFLSFLDCISVLSSSKDAHFFLKGLKKL